MLPSTSTVKENTSLLYLAPCFLLFSSTICYVVASFIEVSYWFAIVFANSSFKFCRSVVKSLSLSSKFSKLCTTYMFLLRGVMLHLFSGSPGRRCISARTISRTFWASLIETGHHKPYLESLLTLLPSDYNPAIFSQSGCRVIECVSE